MKQSKTEREQDQGQGRAQHTPGPWYYGEAFRDNTSDREFFGIGNGACHIGYLSITAAVRMSEAKANAEFIVRACNAHEGLVKALEAVVDYWDNGVELKSKVILEDVCHLAAIARDALAQASIR